MDQGKLVRDKVPEIIRSEGRDPITAVAGAEEYRVRLRAKLREEVGEFLESDDSLDELADILEVVYALAEIGGADRNRLEELRAVKAKERGAFADRVVWFGDRL